MICIAVVGKMLCVTQVKQLSLSPLLHRNSYYFRYFVLSWILVETMLKAAYIVEVIVPILRTLIILSGCLMWFLKGQRI